jgi:hypothetical protein
MFSEVLKIVPKLDSTALNSLENGLSSRFKKVATKFGSGLKSAILGGGILALAGGVINKLLNPLQETQAALEKILQKGDEVNTSAQQFGTTPGRLLKLQAAATGAGLDHGNLDMLLVKFQTAISEAKADKTKDTSVRNFVNETDMAEAFTAFIGELRKLDKNKQIQVQEEVFGERQIGKMSSFLNMDIPKFLNDTIKAKPAASFDEGAKNVGQLNDLSNQLKAQRELSDFNKKSKIVNASMVNANNQSEKIALEQENKRLASYDDLKAAAAFMEKISNKSEDTYLFLLHELQGSFKLFSDISDKISSLLSVVISWRDGFEKWVKNSRLFRGIFGGGDK